MSEHLRALVVILVLSVLSFMIGRQPVLMLGMEAADFKRRRIAWLAITMAAFLAHSFWLFILVAAAILVVAWHREPNRLALYYFVLFAVPPFAELIWGMGLVRQLFALNYLRLLSLVVLLPTLMVLRRQPGYIRFGRHPADWVLPAYLTLQLVLQYGNDTGTNTLRTAFNYFLDVFLPYYVSSRALRSAEDMRDALLAFVVAAAVMGAIGVVQV